MKEKNIEELAARLHTVYQAEAYRQGDVRHVNRYEELPEWVKDFDRALARWIAKNFVNRESLAEIVEMDAWDDIHDLVNIIRTHQLKEG